jgi:hypothetical protein
MKQTTKLRAKLPFKFESQGRTVNVKTGAGFWVTNTEAAQLSSGVVCVARSGQPMHYRYAFKPSDIAVLFSVS